MTDEELERVIRGIKIRVLAQDERSLRKDLHSLVRTTYREAIEEAARALESYASVHSNPVLIALDFQRAAPTIIRRLIEGEDAEQGESV